MKPAQFVVTVSPDILALHPRADIARALAATVKRLRVIGPTKTETAECLPAPAVKTLNEHEKYNPSVK